MEIKFQIEPNLDGDKLIGKPIKRWGIVIGKVTSYNHCNGYAGATIDEDYDELLCKEIGIPTD